MPGSQAAGCSSRNIYREKVTGARADRRELNRMFGKLAPGDVVTVTRIDRLARSTFDLFGIGAELVELRVKGLPVSRDAGIADEAVFRVSFGHILCKP
jgi:DNA invertase Pin-like site-specific DNA recombinase